MKAVETAARQRRIADENKHHRTKRLSPKKQLGEYGGDSGDLLSQMLGEDPENDTPDATDPLNHSIHDWKEMDWIRQFDLLLASRRKKGWVPIEKQTVKIRMQWKHSIKGIYGLTGSSGRWPQEDAALTTYALLRFAAEHWKYLNGDDAYGSRLPEMFSIPWIYGSYVDFLTYADNICRWVNQKSLDDWVAECVAECDDPNSKYRS
jgi:hypothetical protein